MKRNDEFSKGLAGFIDNALADSKHVKVTKREKVNELKSMIQKVLDEIDSKKDDGSKKDANKGISSISFDLRQPLSYLVINMQRTSLIILL